jgi:hypothetical protein
MLLLVYTLVEAPHFGWGSSRTILSFVGVVVLLGVFVAIERSVASPLVRLGILRSRTLVVALVGAMSIYGAYVGWQFITTLYTQQILHWSPLQMALSILPGGLLVAFGAPNTFKLVMRFGLTPVILAGFLSFSIGYALFLRIGPDANYFGSILAPNLLIGLGFALSVPGVNIRIFTGIPMHEQGLASGLLNAGFQVGSAVGLAVVVAVIAAGGGDGGNATTTLHSYYPAIGVTIGIAALGLLASFFGAPRAQPAAAPQSEASMATVEG